MATFVQSADNDGTASATTIALASAITLTEGNLVCVWVGYDGTSTTTTISDTQGNTWTRVGTELSASSYQLGMFYSIITAGGSSTITATFGTARAYRAVAVAEWSPASGTTWAFDVQAGQTQATPGTGTDGVTTGTATNSAQPALIVGLAFSYNGATISAGTSMTSRDNNLWSTVLANSAATMIADRALTTTGAVAATWTASNNSLHFSQMGIFLEQSSSATINQEGFRFGNDDGSETSHTWLAAQDTNAARALDERFLLGVLVDTTGTVGSRTYRLQYRRVGEVTWQDVPVN